MLVNHPLQRLPFSHSPFSNPLQQQKDYFSHQKSLHAFNDRRPKEASLGRAVNFLADYSGCGFWRMLWPQQILNAHQKVIIMNLSVMVQDPNFFRTCSVVRVQRQATPNQLEYIRYLKSIQPQCGFRLIYEIDDIVFKEDIPDYNKFKFAFEDEKIRDSTLEMMRLCDEITVTNEFMRDYYRRKVGKREVTIIPNFPPRFWIGNYYDKGRVSKLYDKYKGRPRILYAGSGAHFDVDNRTGHKDDFEHVLRAVVNTRKKYKWVFLGAFPLQLRPFIDNGDIEFHPWARMFEYPKKIQELEVQMMVAPLQDNNFNRAKSDLKHIEACCYGLPIACQNIVTYKDAPLKFDTGDEMMDLVDKTLKDSKRYKQEIQSRRRVAEARFLERDENIDCYTELYTLPYGHPDRNSLHRYNKDL